MKSKMFAIVVLLFFSVNALAAIVKNPLDHELSKYGPWLVKSKAKEIIIFEVDLNGDGQNEIFITNDIQLHFRAGYSWTVYLSIGAGYIKNTSGDVPSFFHEGVYSGYIDELGKVGLLNYHPGSATDGSLLAYTVDDGVFTEHHLGNIYPAGKDKAIYDKYFNKKVVGVKVKKERFNDVMKALGKPLVIKKSKRVNCGKEEVESGLCSN